MVSGASGSGVAVGVAVGSGVGCGSRNSAATNPSLPSGSRTFFQSLPSAVTSGPMTTISVPSSQTLMLSGSSVAARMLTPSPSVLATRKIVSGGSVGVAVTVGVPVNASSVAVRVDVASVGVAMVARSVAVRVDIASVGVPVVGGAASLGLDVGEMGVAAGATLVAVSVAETLTGEEAS